MVDTEIATYLGTLPLGLTAGVNLFDVPFPEAAPDVAVSVVCYGGQASERALGGAPIAENPRVEVIVRGSRDGAGAAKALAVQVCRALDGLGPITLSGVVFADLRSTQGPPAFLGYDKNGRPRYSCNFEAWKEPS